jgi:hypothetical protein
MILLGKIGDPFFPSTVAIGASFATYITSVTRRMLASEAIQSFFTYKTAEVAFRNR